MKTYFVKSFEDDFVTKTLVGKEKKICQSLEQILKTGIIKPNTKSFGQKKRLSTTCLNDKYQKTYRPQGIIFETEEKPDVAMPFDAVLLSNAQKIVVHYYRIKDTLHEYYNHQLIEGYERFVFDDIAALVAAFPAPEIAWKSVNEFRLSKGHHVLPLSKYRLVEYNEIIFFRPIKIRPVALFGYHDMPKDLAKKYGLRCYRSAAEFYKKNVV